KALARNLGAQTELMKATLEQVRWDEPARLRDLVAQQRARREQSVTGNGHALAMSAASAGMSPAAWINHEFSGLAGLQKIKALDEALEQPAEQARFAAARAELHALICSGARQLLVVAEAHDRERLEPEIGQRWQQTTLPTGASPLALPPRREAVRQLWIANTQVNFCAKAYPTRSEE